MKIIKGIWAFIIAFVLLILYAISLLSIAAWAIITNKKNGGGRE